MTPIYLLDTNIASELIRSAPEPRVVAWIEAHDQLHLSVVSIGELTKGMELLPVSKRRSQLESWYAQSLLPMIGTGILSVTYSISRRWGVISAQRQLAGKPLGLADGLIAATALEHRLTLVTRNVSDFSGLGLVVINPWE